MQPAQQTEQTRLAQTIIERAFPLWCDPRRSSQTMRALAGVAVRCAYAAHADAMAYADADDVRDAIEADAEHTFGLLAFGFTPGNGGAS